MMSLQQRQRRLSLSLARAGSIIDGPNGTPPLISSLPSAVRARSASCSAALSWYPVVPDSGMSSPVSVRPSLGDRQRSSSRSRRSVHPASRPGSPTGTGHYAAPTSTLPLKSALKKDHVHPEPRSDYDELESAACDTNSTAVEFKIPSSPVLAVASSIDGHSGASHSEPRPFQRKVGFDTLTSGRDLEDKGASTGGGTGGETGPPAIVHSTTGHSRADCALPRCQLQLHNRSKIWQLLSKSLDTDLSRRDRSQWCVSRGAAAIAGITCSSPLVCRVHAQNTLSTPLIGPFQILRNLTMN